MAPKLITDTRSTKLKRSGLPANAKIKNVSFVNGKRDASTQTDQHAASANGKSDANTETDQHAAFANGNSESSSTTSEESVTLANGRSDSSTTTSEQFVGSPLSSLPVPAVNPNIPADNPNPVFAVSEELFVVKHGYDAANYQLAIYIAMAHAGLVVAIAICYGFSLLLKDFWTPIQWALLVSMPLQRVQTAVVKFWMRHLQAGLVEAFFAIPAAMLKALIQTAIDIRSFLMLDGAVDDVTFGKLFDWLFSLATCTLLLENLDILYSMVVACIGCAIYWPFNTMHSTVSAFLSGWLHQAQQRRGTGARVLDFTVRATRWSNRGVAGTLIKNLPSLVALQLISSMIAGFIAGTILFSYKVGVEAKDAIIALRIHMDNSRSEAGKGVSNWLETDSTYHFIDSHMMVAYDTVVDKVDKYAEKNNMTAVANAAKEFLNAIAYNETIISSPTTTQNNSFWEKFISICKTLQEKIEKREFKQLMKNLVSGGGGVFKGSYSLLVVLGSNVANFVRQVIVFVVVLFFLITSETGGVMEQALEMVPLSEVTRQKCATLLDRTISKVLLTSVKLMIFQALFTYTFYRFLQIHFLYMSTSIALVQGLMPVYPNWVASLPALLQFLAERRILSGLLTTVIYKLGIDYGVGQIQGVVSSYNRYLTGLSIAGGMALFQPAIYGVIMGPLILTCIMAIRDLYAEFVLKLVHNYQRI